MRGCSSCAQSSRFTRRRRRRWWWLIDRVACEAARGGFGYKICIGILRWARLFDEIRHHHQVLDGVRATQCGTRRPISNRVKCLHGCYFAVAITLLHKHLVCLWTRFEPLCISHPYYDHVLRSRSHLQLHRTHQVSPSFSFIARLSNSFDA